MSSGGAKPRNAEAGFTLVEVLVALMLFALISAAGFMVLDQILRVQASTDGRLDRLAQVQRVMHLVATDFMQAESGSLGVSDEFVSVRRAGAASAAGVSYRLRGQTLVRTVSGTFGQAATEQNLLTGVGGLEWQFFHVDTGWLESWPPADRPHGNPAAIEMTLMLDGPGLSGQLRRVALLPADPAW